MRLLLRNRAPTLALISRAFYPAVVVTPLSSKSPQPLLLFLSAVICRAFASSAQKVHSSHPLVLRAFYPAVVITPLSSKLPQPLRLSPSAAICHVFESSALLVHLLLRNRVPTHAVIQRAFYPAVVVTPLSSKLPLSCVAIRCNPLRRRIMRSTSALASAHSRPNPCPSTLVPHAFHQLTFVAPLRHSRPTSALASA